MDSTPHRPTLILSLDAEEQAPSEDALDELLGDRYSAARLLIWADDLPVAIADVDRPDDGAPMGPRITAALTRHRTDLTGDPTRVDRKPGPEATVVVATRDRPAEVLRCLDSIAASTDPPAEVLVVDNAPPDDATVQALRGTYAGASWFRYLREPTPGLALAHNAALEHVETETVFFTDDDVVVDRRWTSALRAAFSSDDRIDCVTGLIVPTELETATQWLLEHSIGFGKGLEPRLYDIEQHRPDDALFPFTAGTLGSGANMAFRMDHLRAVGGFDRALGAGTIASGGDDLASFIEVLAQGGRLRYAPDAVVFHPHHRSQADAHGLVTGYGRGLTAAMTSAVVRNPQLLPALLRRAPAALKHALAPGSAKNRRRPPGYPPSMVRAETRGMISGPWAYLRSRYATRHVAGPTIPARTPGTTRGGVPA